MTDIIGAIQILGYEVRDPRMDGYNCFRRKQELYKILWETQRQLELSPHFTIEDDWLNEQKQIQFVEKLQGQR